MHANTAISGRNSFSVIQRAEVCSVFDPFMSLIGLNRAALPIIDAARLTW